jgi:hypothetical protein
MEVMCDAAVWEAIGSLLQQCIVARFLGAAILFV